VERRRGERGSALLIVFVFAAVLLIMLYREIPVASFEAQRQKEQLTVDRGHEYQRAVQLYYRRFRGQYPANLEQLENTNNLRFLRRRYKDPLTGKDDWRLLHAGPGGMLTDSKVNPMGLNANGQNANGQNANGLGSKTGQTNQTNGSGSSGFGSFDTPAADTSTVDQNAVIGPDGQPVSNKPHHSAPAIAATGNAADASNGTPSTAELNADPSKPLLPSTPDSSGQANAANAAGPGATNNSGTFGNSGAFGNGGAFGNAGTSGNAGAAGNAGTGTAPTPGQTAMNLVTGNGSNALNGQNGSANGGLMGGGGIAGVASKAVGLSIKKVNDQTQYQKWEFYYDPSKDTGASGRNGMQNNGPAGMPGLNNNSLSGTPSNTNSSGFGNSSQQGTTATDSGQALTPAPIQGVVQPTAPAPAPDQNQ
jgi:hypothetical protein